MRSWYKMRDHVKHVQKIMFIVLRVLVLANLAGQIFTYGDISSHRWNQHDDDGLSAFDIGFKKIIKFFHNNSNDITVAPEINNRNALLALENNTTANSKHTKVNSQKKVNNKQTKVNSQQTKVNSQQTKDNSQQTKDNSQQTKDNTQQTKDNSQQTKDNSQQIKDNKQQTKDNSQETKVNSRRSLDSRNGLPLGNKDIDENGARPHEDEANQLKQNNEPLQEVIADVVLIDSLRVKAEESEESWDQMRQLVLQMKESIDKHRKTTDALKGLKSK